MVGVAAAARPAARACRSLSTKQDALVDASTVVAGGVTSTRTGSFRMLVGQLARSRRAWSPRTAASGAPSAASPTMLRTSRMKPMSSMRSASSRTKISTRVEAHAPCSIRSSSRPGVATKMSTPRRERIDLRPLADAAEDDGGRSAGGGHRSRKLSAIWMRQFARGREDSARSAALRRGLLGGQALQDRQREGGRLAGAGLGDAQQVAAGEDGAEWPAPGSASAGRSSAQAKRAGSARQGRAVKMTESLGLYTF